MTVVSEQQEYFLIFLGLDVNPEYGDLEIGDLKNGIIASPIIMPTSHPHTPHSHSPRIHPIEMLETSRLIGIPVFEIR